MNKTKQQLAIPRLKARAHMAASHKALLTALAVAGVMLLTLEAPRAVAQGCAMCYQNAAASGTQGSATLRHGILILLLPALTVFLGIFVFIYRRRHVAR